MALVQSHSQRYTQLPTSSVKPFRGSGTPVADGREEEGEGEGLCRVKDVVVFLLFVFSFFCGKLQEENRSQLCRAEPEANH